MTKYINLGDLKHGFIYKIHARNLCVGVWDKNAQGFIGIRHKLGSQYLFTELEYTTNSRFGTAMAVEALDESVPEGVRVSEALDPVCRHCGDRTYSAIVADPSWPRGQRCTGDKHYVNSACPLEGTYCAVTQENKDLYDLLCKIEDRLDIKYTTMVDPTTVEN